MKEYKKPLIEDELVEIDDVIALSGLTLASSTDDDIQNDEGEVYSD